jgi:hypothetical protein
MGDAADADAINGRPDPKGRPAARPEAAQNPPEMTDKDRIVFACTRNAAYHEDMEAFYARWHRRFMFIVVVVGTLSAGASLAKENEWATIGTAIAVLAGLVDLLWDVDGNARLHSTLRRRCFDLLARLEADEELKSIKAEYIRIIADEPPAFGAVNALAFNAAVDALGRPPDQKYKVTWWESLWRHWFRYQANEFPEIGKSRKQA